MNRYEIQVWKFGSIWQTVVEVAYGDEPVRIQLLPSRTKAIAKKKCAKWIRSYKAKGPLSPEKLIKTAFKNWPDLYQRRIDILDHIFCTTGNGYEWLDGAIVCCTPEDHKGSSAFEALGERNDPPSPGPKLDLGEPYDFYPISKEYSNICNIPDDARPEWLALAKETAALIRTRATDPSLVKLLPKHLLGT